MKNLRSDENLRLASELSNVIAKRKEYEKRERELKDYFLNLADNKAGLLKIGEVLIVITDCERATLDRKALEAKYGADKIKAFDKVTTYLKTEVKAA
jgi:hypothetical protein